MRYFVVVCALPGELGGGIGGVVGAGGGKFLGRHGCGLVVDGKLGTSCLDVEG